MGLLLLRMSQAPNHVGLARPIQLPEIDKDYVHNAA